MFRKAKGNQKGFTLLEILIVIGIIAILATVVLIALNPARQFAQARNSQRVSNVNTILNAIGQYVADNKGELPATFTTSAQDFSDISGLCANLIPTYIPSLPTDPKSTFDGASIDCTTMGTTDIEYDISEDADGRITVSAPLTEISSTTISVTR